MTARKRPGQTLIEVTMATMIAAVTTTAVFSVVLSSFVSDARADKRDAAAMVIRHAQEVLKSYVSAVPTESAYIPTGSRGVGRWPADSSGAWALRTGSHNISSLLNGTPLQGGSFTYTVVSYNCGFGSGSGACKRVTFNLSYQD